MNWNLFFYWWKWLVKWLELENYFSDLIKHMVAGGRMDGNGIMDCASYGFSAWICKPAIAFICIWTITIIPHADKPLHPQCPHSLFPSSNFLTPTLATFSVRRSSYLARRVITMTERCAKRAANQQLWQKACSRFAEMHRSSCGRKN